MYTNFSWITDHLAVGGFVEGVAPAEEFPFDAALSLEVFAPLALAPLVRSGRVDYAWEPLFDGVALPQEQLMRHVDAAADHLDVWLGAGKRALVHCYAGVSRSVIAVTWYLMRSQGLSWNAAFAQVKAHRRAAFPDIRFELPLRLASGEPRDGDWISERLVAFCRQHHAETGRALDLPALAADLRRYGIPVSERDLLHAAT